MTVWYLLIYAVLRLIFIASGACSGREKEKVKIKEEKS